MSHIDDMQVFCVMCKTEVPLDRKKRRSVTCSDECAKSRNNYLRERKELRKCKYCGTPSTPEEREDFRRWRRERKMAVKKAQRGDAEEYNELPPICPSCAVSITICGHTEEDVRVMKGEA